MIPFSRTPKRHNAASPTSLEGLHSTALGALPDAPTRGFAGLSAVQKTGQLFKFVFGHQINKWIVFIMLVYVVLVIKLSTIVAINDDFFWRL